MSAMNSVMNGGNAMEKGNEGPLKFGCKGRGTAGGQEPGARGQGNGGELRGEGGAVTRGGLARGLSGPEDIRRGGERAGGRRNECDKRREDGQRSPDDGRNHILHLLFG